MKTIGYNNVIEKENILENKKRVKILKYVFENPGCFQREIVDYTGMRSTFMHLKVLEKFELIKKRNVKYFANFVRIESLEEYGLDCKYFRLFKRPEQQKMQIEKKLSKEQKIIYDCLKGSDPCFSREISEKTGMDLVETIFYIRKMEDLISFEIENGRKKYSIKQA